MGRELQNKPLVEAILEVRWRLQGASPGPQTDPHYKLLLGRVFDRFTEDYPEHEQLSTANIPDDLVGHIIQHRFRVGANSWPLVQLGPGIFTVNSTDDYKWLDFRPRVLSAVKRLYDAHPKVSDFKVTSLVLRYIDAVNFDHTTNNAFDFLRDKLKLTISLPNVLFEKTGVEDKPNGFACHCSFKCQKPKGMVNIRFANGQKNNMPAIVWETIVESAGEDLPEIPSAFETWLDEAHEISGDWFFKMIEGELKRRFSGEQSSHD